MKIQTIHHYSDFCRELETAGFSLGGENGEGIFTLCDHFSPEIIWHTGEPETDPWAWRIRAPVTKSAAYAKIFFSKGGWITKAWYPNFLAVRRRGRGYEEMYREGLVSHLEWEICSLVGQYGHLSLHALKEHTGCTKETQSKFEGALTKAQMHMFLTICGEEQKVSKSGEPYGWPSTVFCPAEDFFEPAVWKASLSIRPEEAYAAIADRIRLLNPEMNEKKLKKFIGG